MARAQQKGNKKNTRQQRWKERNRWARLLEWARRRCRENVHYVKRAIRCELTGKEMKALWKRDGGDKMTRPSLDRRDATLGYTFGNYRVVEFWLNVRAPHDPEAAALLNGESDDAPAWVTREDCDLAGGYAISS